MKFTVLLTVILKSLHCKTVYLTQMNKIVTFPNHLMFSFNSRSLATREQLIAENKGKSFHFPCLFGHKFKNFSHGLSSIGLWVPLIWEQRIEFRFFRTTFRILAIPRVYLAWKNHGLPSTISTEVSEFLEWSDITHVIWVGMKVLCSVYDWLLDEEENTFFIC